MVNVRDANLNFRSLTRGNNPVEVIIHHALHDNCTVRDVHQWHRNNGWQGIGYHYFVRRNGEIWRGRPEWATGAHVPQVNSSSIGICLEGCYQEYSVGGRRLTQTSVPKAQMDAVVALTKDVQKRNNIANARVKRHHDYSPKLCPGNFFPWNDFKSRLSGGSGSGSTGSNSGSSKPSTGSGKGDQNTDSIVTYLNSIGADSSYSNRAKLASQHGISNYSGTASQNTELLNKLRSGSKPAAPPSSGSSGSSKGDQNTDSIVTYLNSIGVDSSYSNRAKLASQHGISNYSGTASQNTQLLNKMRSGSAPSNSGGGNSGSSKLPAARNGEGIVDYLNRVGIDSSYSNRARLASQHGINNYSGTASQNSTLLNRISGSSSSGSTSRPKPRAGEGIVAYMNRVGMDSSYSNRAKLASQHGISNYSGTAAQNNRLLNAISG